MNPQVKKFLLKLIVILLPFLILFSWIEYKARNLPNSYSVKKDQLEKICDSVEILVLGSSHAMKGIDPSCFRCKGFNLSNSSQTLIHDIQLCQKYLERLPRLKAVIFEISYFSFYFDINNSPESWRNYFYYHYFDIRDPSLDRFSPPAYFYTALYTRGLINDIVFNKLDHKKEFGDIRAYGWEYTDPPDDSTSVSGVTGKQRVRFHEFLMKKENAGEIISSLRKTLGQLQKNGIRIFFVTAPVYKTYYSHFDPVRVNDNLAIIKELCRDFPVTYSDYSQDPRFGKEDFFDNDHLNHIGAYRFSRILDEELLSSLCVKE